MASEYASVDDFVNAYLADCSAPPSAVGHWPQQQQVPSNIPLSKDQGLNSVKLGAEGGVAHVYAAMPQQQGYDAPAAGRWDPTAHDVYMQPFDQADTQPMGVSYGQPTYLSQYDQQQDWELQQQQQQQQQHQHLNMLLPHPVHGQQPCKGWQQHPIQHVQSAELSYMYGADASCSAMATERVGSNTQQGAAARSNSQTQGKARKNKQAHQAGPAAAGAMSINPVLGHGSSAAAVMHPTAAAAPPRTQAVSPSFSTAYGQPGNLTSVMLLQQAAKQQPASAAAMQPGVQQGHDEEPDMSHLTVMQRYHARRKLAVQRMEREVEEKIAQLAILEQENRQLKWQAHILENMLLDMDKQVELMSTNELPDASQWLTLLGMGTNAAAGSSGNIARTLHKMLDGASKVDITGWTPQDCRRKWLSYLEQLRPLVEEAESAQAAYRASSGPGGEQQSSRRQQAPQRPPRRAAAAAAAMIIKHEAAEVLGVAPIDARPMANIPDVPSQVQQPPGAVSSPAESPADTPADGSSMQDVQPHDSPGSSSTPGETPKLANSEHSAGSMTSSEVSHGPNVEGIPYAVLHRIEELVMQNFYWLLAIMTRNPVLTYEFISVDLVEAKTPLPPQQDELWSQAVDRVELTLEQQQECCTCLQVSHRCMAKVIEERAEITAAMQPCVNKPQTAIHSQAWLSFDMLNQNQVDVSVDRMRANVRKESVVRNLVGFYCINVVSLYQLAQLSLACSPWFCMAWRVIGAVEIKLEQHLAREAAALRQPLQGVERITRSSSRSVATTR